MCATLRAPWEDRMNGLGGLNKSPEGVVIGLVNGWFIGYWGLSPFIFTLAMLLVGIGCVCCRRRFVVP